jgi:hypothetical protein
VLPERSSWAFIRDLIAKFFGLWFAFYIISPITEASFDLLLHIQFTNVSWLIFLKLLNDVGIGCSACVCIWGFKHRIFQLTLHEDEIRLYSTNYQKPYPAKVKETHIKLNKIAKIALYKAPTGSIEKVRIKTGFGKVVSFDRLEDIATFKEFIDKRLSDRVKIKGLGMRRLWPNPTFQILFFVTIFLIFHVVVSKIIPQ